MHAVISTLYRRLVRPLLFSMPPEKAHQVTMGLLMQMRQLPGVADWLQRRAFSGQHPALKRNFFGIEFPNPVGLAAGFDKDGRWIEPLSDLGFGFIEIGTVTPLPQLGNEPPRLFRLPEQQALLNRMGFNNDGVDVVAGRLAQLRAKEARKRECSRGMRQGGNQRPMIIGGNIGRNKATKNKNAHFDYMTCFDALHPYVDYFVVNVSSPNTPGLRDLQNAEMLITIFGHLKAVNLSKAKPKPILIKIAPELNEQRLNDIVDIMYAMDIHGIVATNTLSNDPLEIHHFSQWFGQQVEGIEKAVENLGTGGISGTPLANKSTEMIRYLRKKLNKGQIIIGVGGIFSPQDALDKLAAGADLVQLYTGFIYEGPSLIEAINQAVIGKAENTPSKAKRKHKKG